MKRFAIWFARGWAAILISALVLQGCGGGGGGSYTPVNSTATPLAQPTSAVLAQTAQAGSVQMPAGSTLSASSLTVYNSLGSSAVSSSGTFSLNGFSGGGQFATVANAQGNPVMVGFLSAREPQINAHTTAEVLAYFASGLFVIDPSLRQQAYAQLASAPGFAAIEAAVTSDIANNPGSFPAAAAALKGFAATLARARRPGVSGSGASAARRTIQGVVVNPSTAQSGVTVLNQQPVQIAFQNNWRRLALAYVDQVSYGTGSGSSTSIVKAPKTDVIPPVNNAGSLSGDFLAILSACASASNCIPAVTGLKTFSGSLSDTFYGNVAGGPIQTGNITLPVASGSLWTRYQITVVGPGANPGAAAATLTNEQILGKNEAAMLFAITDFVLPLLAGIIFPYATDLKLFGGNVTQDQANALADIANALSADPNIANDAYGGNMWGALELAFAAIAASPQVSTAIVNAILKFVWNNPQYYFMSNQAATAQEFADKLGNATKLADAILVGSDAVAVGATLANSNQAEKFDVVVVPAKIILTPATSSVQNSNYVVPSFSVNVPEANNSDFCGALPCLNLTYNWMNTAQYGHFCDLSTKCDNTGGNNGSFTSTVNQGTYLANATGQGTDTITVAVTALDSSGDKVIPIPLGTAQAAVAVVTPTPSPLGSPPSLPESRCAPMTVSSHQVTVGQTITATVQDQGPKACGGDIPGGVPPSWTWSGYQTATSGCTKSSDSCVFTATTSTLNQTSTGGYSSICLNGSSTQGPWISCDYYAVLPATTSSGARTTPK